MWRISTVIRRVVRTTLLRLAARLEEPDAAPAQPPDEEGIPADWLARVRRGAPQLLRKDAPSYAVVRRPVAKSSDDADSPAETATSPRVVENATAAPRSSDARMHAQPDVTATPPRAPRVDDGTPVRPRAPRVEERAPMTPRLVPTIADDAPLACSRNTTGAHSDTSPDEPRARSRQFPAAGIAGVPDVDAPARPSPHSFDSPAESQVVSRLASEPLGSPGAHRHALTRASRFPLPQAGEGQPFDGHQGADTRFPAPRDAQENAPSALAAPRHATAVAPLHSQYQTEWQTFDHEEWQSRYHGQYHGGYHRDYHRRSDVVVADGESSPQPQPSWPELPDAPLFGIPLTPIATFDDAEHLARLSDEQRGSAWSE